jgi:hypothetical protein
MVVGITRIQRARTGLKRPGFDGGSVSRIL